MSNEFIKQRVMADREQLVQSINELQSRIAQQSGAVQYMDMLLQQIKEQEAKEAAEAKQKKEVAKAVAENMAEVGAGLMHEPDYGAPRYDE